MDADHVTAWIKGGATSEKNCQNALQNTIGKKEIGEKY